MKFRIILVFSIWILLFIFLLNFKFLIVQGNSMLPFLKNGDLILIYKLKNKVPLTNFSIDNFSISINTSDVVIWNNEKNGINIKRVIGKPFEFYKFQDNKIIINDEILIEPYLFFNSKTIFNKNMNEIEKNRFGKNELLKEGRIPENFYLLLGDNREHSSDSRNYGFIYKNEIIGKLLFKF